MAASLGSILVLACVAVFFTTDRTDGLLARRAEQAADLQRLRLVVQRATSTLVMSNAPQVTQTDGVRAGARGLEVTNTDASQPAPRLIIDRDPLMGRYSMTSSGGGQWRPDQARVQRYEVVLSDPPVPSEAWDLFRARAWAAASGVRGRARGLRRGFRRGASFRARARASSATGAKQTSVEFGAPTTRRRRRRRAS